MILLSTALKYSSVYKKHSFKDVPFTVQHTLAIGVKHCVVIHLLKEAGGKVKPDTCAGRNDGC